jgi:CheY-like chemotaxis protein
VSPATVLVVEDSALTLELVADLLEAAGYRVLRAESAERGIAAALEHRAALVLMDVALPGLDGLAATERLKRDPRTASIPVVALSAQVMREDRERARAAGCTGFIPKPIDTRSFARTVAAFLGVDGAARPAERPDEGQPSRRRPR